MSYGKNDVVNAATKLARLVNGGVVGYYAGGKTSEVMKQIVPEQLIDVVDRHKKVQLGTSLAQSFVPGAGIPATALAVASLWKMYYDINQVLGIKISENAGKSLTSAVLTNLSSAAAQGVATAVSEGVKFIPFVGWIASAGISAATSTAIVYGAAYLYLNALSAMYSAKGQFDFDYLESEILNDSDSEYTLADSEISNPSSHFYSNNPQKNDAITICSIVADNLGLELEDVSPDSDLEDDLGADEDDIVEIMETIENRFGVNLGDADSITFVDDFIEKVIGESFFGDNLFEEDEEDDSDDEDELNDDINEDFSFTIQRRYIGNDGNLHLIGKVDSGIIEVGDYIVPLDSDGLGHGWKQITALRINNYLTKSLLKGQQGDIVITATNAGAIENCSIVISREEDGGQSHFRLEFSDFCNTVDNSTEMMAEYDMLEAHDDDLSRFIGHDFVAESVKNEFYFLDSLYALYFIKTYNDGFGDITIEQVKNAAKIALSKSELIDYNEDEEYNLAKTLARIVYYKYVVANDSKRRMEINAIPSSFDDMSNALLSPYFWQSLCSSIVNDGQSKHFGGSFEKNEQEYIDEVRDCLSDGEIGPRERRLLEKIREKLGISKERAVVLEATLLATQLSDEEQEYLTEFKECVVDGMVSAKERRLLEKMRIMLGISEQRAKELESNFGKN